MFIFCLRNVMGSMLDYGRPSTRFFAWSSTLRSDSMLSFMYGCTLVWALMLGPNRIKAKDVKICTYCCYVRCVLLIVRYGGNALAPNRRNALPCIVKSFRQGSCNQRFDCLLGSMVRIYFLLELDRFLDKRKLRGLVTCCCQDGYWAQLPEHHRFIQIRITMFLLVVFALDYLRLLFFANRCHFQPQIQLDLQNKRAFAHKRATTNTSNK